MVIYVAGPYRAGSAWYIEQNVRRAETVSYYVWASGHVAICPHTNTRFFDGSLPDQVFIDGTLEMMRRCDAVMVLPNHEGSQGTRGEIAEAERLGMPVALLGGLDPLHIKDALAEIEEQIAVRGTTQRGTMNHG